MRAFGKKPGGGRRSADRDCAPLTAVFTTVAYSRSVRLVDLSCSGAKLHGAVLPEIGEEFVLSVGRLRAFATVVWAEQGQCGVKFDLPLDPADLGFLHREAAALGCRSLEIAGALEDWTTGFAR